MQALHQEILPPSGVEYAATLKLTPATLADSATPSTSTSYPHPSYGALYNVVVARANILRIFEVTECPAQFPQHQDERNRRADVPRGTEAVEGEVEMDTQGEGFVNLGSVKLTGPAPPTTIRFHFIREHRLHGTVTGLESIRIMSSFEDRLDRLLVSFKDAKIALLEWSAAVHDLITVSIHTYERAPQLLSLDTVLFKSELRSDPASRCAALSLPKDALAILPFYQSQADLDVMEQDFRARDVPYSPSFVLDLAASVDERIKNVVDFVFLPGFNNPTVAVLFQSQQTWTGRLKEFKDTMSLYIFTLDLVSRIYPTITKVDGLPYDCLSLIPCSSSLGGVVILTSNAVIHVDQATRRVALPVNGWPPRVSDMPTLATPAGMREMRLEGARMAFVDERTLFVVLVDGTIIPIEFVVDGKVVSRLVPGAALAQTAPPTVVRKLHREHLFVGSTVGPSALLRTASVEEPVTELDEMATSGPAAVVDAGNAMDLDDDDDIYGTSSPDPLPSTSTAPSAKTRTVIHLSLCDSLPAYGPISDLSFALAKNGDRFVPELVTATGSNSLGGFTLFQRDLPTRTKRKLHAIGGARGLWSLPVRTAVKVNGVPYDRPANPFHAENDSLILGTDAIPSPGFSRFGTRTPKGDITITTRVQGVTVGAAPFFEGTAILHVLSNAIRVLDPDGTERQIIKDMEGNNQRPRIKYCSICDPFVFILREDDTMVYLLESPSAARSDGKTCRQWGRKWVSDFALYRRSFFMDSTGIFKTRANENGPSANGDATSTLHSAMDAGQKTQWLMLCRPQGVVEIWTLPKLSLAFSTTAIASLQNVLVDSFDPPALSLPQDPPRRPQELDIEQILISPIGENVPWPYLLVFLRCGQLAVYQALPAEPSSEPIPAARTSTLAVKFAKTCSRAFEIQHPEEQESTALAEHRRISRQLIPFVTSPAPDKTLSGVFLTGENPSWIVQTDRASVKVIPSGHTVVHAFTATSLWDWKGDFLLYSDEGPTLLEWMPDVDLNLDMPSRHIHRGRSYTNIVFEPTNCLMVAASLMQAPFSSYDEDANELWTPDVPNVSYPTSECSALELFSTDFLLSTGMVFRDCLLTVVLMNGFFRYEFAPNEFINSLACVPLETLSTESGHKNFIATYVFEIVEVVPDHNLDMKRSFKLRLRCRDEAKDHGYLVSSMGQKIFVRAFDLDERLVGVAFLDVGVYVTTLRALKNLLIIGDAVKSIGDPYKLAVLAKDPHKACVTASDFFFVDQQLSIVTCDEEGAVRMYEYDPHSPESNNGQNLLCRTEFHSQSEYRSSVTIARRMKGEDMVAPQAKLICGHPDGSLTALVPVDEATFKRLHLLQGQLTRNVQHIAGLNPRAFRLVRNDYVSKPLSYGILDGRLLASFEDLPLTRQSEITRPIGTERAAVLHDLRELGGSW
ncbi:CPSF A subunit region-domain-containing protein [Lactarius quietus]|nr:CPSF A subunit region-domain-containing protein [Lactarius quietus]